VFVLFVLFAGFGAAASYGGVTAVSFSETPAFCGLCHTMAPELKAYQMSPHKDVACAACHVGPGVGGFVEAKLNGTIQLAEVITGKYPTPIPPPNHAKLPPVQDTCLTCHSLSEITANGGPVKLILGPSYLPDEANTKQTVAVMIRPAGLGGSSGVLGVHWHVQQTVTYTTPDIHSSKIDLVQIKAKDGTTKTYIAGSAVTESSNVTPDIARLKATETTRLMDCLDCHNRIGHEVPTPDAAIDAQINAGNISTALPFIKRNGLALLNGNYPTVQAANKAIAGLATTYATQYPLVYKTDVAQISKAITALETEYQLIATPAMKVMAKTYPDNLGHMASLGCFRCHDGAHFLVVNGKVTTQTIPSACSTCHTFPQIGPSTAAPASFPLGTQPADHQDKLYVFDHKTAVHTTDPTGTSCAACHSASYCQDCHNSGAIKVDHDVMLTNHAAAAVAAGGTQACAYCHLPVFCSQCHKGPVGSTSTMPSLTANPAASLFAPKSPLAIPTKQVS
jgi:nitrate/TMAO reductase-like tetraheme cytochrome c subunit